MKHGLSVNTHDFLFQLQADSSTQEIQIPYGHNLIFKDSSIAVVNRETNAEKR